MNFAAKQQVIDILDNYNARMAAEGRTDMQIQYTDFIGVLMGSVTDIVSMVTVALIAFVAISLVVSSIMIGVITYISVLERRKEIGILRAIGASKLNIRQVFNAETLIVGFIAGALGILVTYLLTVVANAIIAARFDIHGIARLPISAALALIAVSMVLTFVSGLIPSSAAAREDPVAALRSE
jgi:ABC-type antimicrobial peptide transport system permease subunit